MNKINKKKKQETKNRKKKPPKNHALKICPSKLETSLQHQGGIDAKILKIQNKQKHACIIRASKLVTSFGMRESLNHRASRKFMSSVKPVEVAVESTAS